MKLFEIAEDYSRKGSYIDAVHRWGLPGLECPACQAIWSTVGLEYPLIDLSSFEFESLYREPRLESLETYRELERNIRRAFPHLTELAPGAEFGPALGR